ncbi:MAG: hypothetical protein H6953_11730 [Chromatiaceae bacterium]|nr:hypothetical protein [Chromatiaceae bacterium]MCP5315983.1 hypothetical protein [Chromatiaceae bacterium]
MNTTVNPETQVFELQCLKGAQGIDIETRTAALWQKDKALRAEFPDKAAATSYFRSLALNSRRIATQNDARVLSAHPDVRAFWESVTKAEARGLSRAQAIRKVAVDDPNLHGRYLSAVNR